MKREDIVARRPEDLTLRKLDVWANHGMFGHSNVYPGRGQSREFTDEDARVAEIVGAISGAFERQYGGRGGPIDLYVCIANAVRSGRTDITIEIEPGIALIVDTEELQ